MKIPKLLLLLFAAFAALGVMTPPHARADVSFSFFYDSLDPYGEWVDVPDYGYVWHPSNVDDNWAPYSDGYWAYTDDGWTWVSYEDYGGIVYHYGRWTRIPGEGWVWVPGETWAPAWVSWRSNDDYVGWAPLPPEARWHAGVGFSTYVDARFDIGPACFNFVGVRDFGAPALGAVIVNREQNVTIINRTTNITNITTINNTNVYNGGPQFAALSARSARPIPTLKLVRQNDASRFGAGRKILSRQQGNQLVVISPKVTATAANGIKPIPAKVARTLSGVKADHGWSGVKDPGARKQLEEKIKSQSAPDNVAAKPVNPADIKLVDEKIKAGGNKGKGNGAGAQVNGGDGGTDQGTAQGFAPGAGKGKGKKGNVTPADNSDLINAPATDTTAGAASTPKGVKGKKGKPAVTDNAIGNDTGNGMAASDTMPIPKKGKGKGAKTPATGFTDSVNSGADTYATPIPKKGKGKGANAPTNGFTDSVNSGADTYATPIPKKGKGKPSNPASEGSYLNGTGQGATGQGGDSFSNPGAKKSKGKKPASADSFDSGYSQPTSQPKRPKQDNGGGLQPFNAGGGGGGNGDGYGGGNGGGKRPKNFEAQPIQRMPVEPKAPKGGDKGGGKKGKKQADDTPMPGQ